MPSSQPPSAPPYRQIAEEIRSWITTGALRPGDRAPSVRQIAQRWGVAIATATRVTAVLRDEGLVESRVGSGTVVTGRGVRAGTTGADTPAPVAAARRPGVAPPPLNRRNVLRTAIAIADVEGIDAVSMRRLASELGVGPMSLYRHVANKDELVRLMADQAFGEVEPPEPGPPGWRAKLELSAREQWRLCHRHLWLARAVSFTRPSMAPAMMAHTEWVLRALDGLGLSEVTRFHEAVTLHSLVLGFGASLADEAEAEQSTGVTLDGWWRAERPRSEEVLGDGRFPLLAQVPRLTPSDLEELFEYGLARHLDGLAVLVERQAGHGDTRP